MTANNLEAKEILDISSQTHELETALAGETDEVKRETKALIEAIAKRAQAEAAGTITRETYLNTVRQAREAIERQKLTERDHRLEYSWAVMQDEAERNWYLLMKEAINFSDRLQKAAKAAWEAFNYPHSQS
ncbi:hypothetical protein [Cylindrospermum sp. FACHB-282]|uniref:hypothetical protein n=1 Tax=Cylindrospermum sp. FACHB-282 TaxID=2692794 RepID=UPI0016837E59|nr:hypothetical protein [Cylindrospermum sp. FACHB-282]MBD2385930.1 hypothetical protein [Cylindrospermum sp. FACHB-282]